MSPPGSPSTAALRGPTIPRPLAEAATFRAHASTFHQLFRRADNREFESLPPQQVFAAISGCNCDMQCVASGFAGVGPSATNASANLSMPLVSGRTGISAGNSSRFLASVASPAAASSSTGSETKRSNAGPRESHHSPVIYWWAAIGRSRLGRATR